MSSTARKLGTASAGVDADVLRFGFGANWQRFATTLDEDRIAEAERHLAGMLGDGALVGRSFLDIGSGSGLSSLAAARLGATRIVSFDFDWDSVACTSATKLRYLPMADHWSVGHGDVVDERCMASLGHFDVVYSWGVLHHTGQMWRALENACAAVNQGGSLHIAIYNDLGMRSRVWRAIKRSYNRAPVASRPLLVVLLGIPLELRALAAALMRGELRDYLRSWRRAGERGMNRWHDLVDWIGGYPYEAAKPEQIFDFCRTRGFTLEKLTTTHNLGTNEFVFRRTGRVEAG